MLLLQKSSSLTVMQMTKPIGMRRTAGVNAKAVKLSEKAESEAFCNSDFPAWL
jgi:hypothetical protein